MFGARLRGREWAPATPVASPTGRGAAGRLKAVPALDGLRGLSVAAVLLFHGSVGTFRGGHLGVTVFFTLSGFLITSLLLAERAATGRIDLPGFWLRRARRLLPAMLVCLPLVAVVERLSTGPVGRGVFGDGVASLAWVANWRFILHRATYGDLFALPSPFQHFWSLSVEEQFYVAFPLLLCLVLRRASGAGRRGWLAAALMVLCLASTLQLVTLNATGAAFSRAYYGTDSRGAELLVGALLAVAMATPHGLRQLGPRAGRTMSVVGCAAFGVLGWACLSLAKDDPLLYRGGFLAAAVCAAAVIATAVQEGSLLARVLSFPPAVRLGVISYGVYVYHWPLFLLLTPATTGLTGAPLLVVRLAVTVGLALASFALLEQPVRRGRVEAGPLVGGWAAAAVAGMLALALVTGVLPLPSSPPRTEATATREGGQPVIGRPGVGPSPTARGGGSPQAGASPAGTSRSAAAAAGGGGAGRAAAGVRGAAPAPKASRPPTQSSGSTIPTEFTAPPSSAAVPPPPNVPPGALKVAVLGDSLGNNLGNGLVHWAQGRTDVAVYNLAIPACPLSRGHDRRLSADQEFDVDPACGWWDDAGSQRRQALDSFAPDLIVTQDAINEVFDRRFDAWGGWRSPGDSDFDSWLAQEYQALFAQRASAGARILVTNAACGDWMRSFQQVANPQLRISALNLLYDRAQGVTVGDFFDRVCPNGQFSDTVEGVPNARPDGFHFTEEASNALATNWLGPLILQTLHGTTPLGVQRPSGGGR